MKSGERTRQLTRYRLLDAKPIKPLDRLTELARTVFAVPMAAVTLIGDERQVFKSRCGFDITDTDRSTAFCDRTIEDDDVFVVRDAAAHPVFSHSPLVTGDPKVRFYAGAPVSVRPGWRVGALCIMDTSPRTFLPDDCRLLQMLADEVGEQIRTHRLTFALNKEIRVRRRQNGALLEHKRQLDRNARMFRQVADLAKVGAWSFRPDTREVVWSDEIFKIMEMSPDPDCPGNALQNLVPDDRQRLMDAIFNSRRRGEAFKIEVQFITAGENLRWGRITAEPGINEDGAMILHGALQDVTEQVEAEKEAKRLATVDGLTGLPNREVFRTAVGRLLEEPDSTAIDALLLLDLDDFKDINDTLGHDAGDWLLHRMSRRLRHCVRGRDMIGRLGGDEFGMLLRDRTSPGEVAATAQIILDAATAPTAYRGHTLRVGASVGIALRRHDSNDAASLLKAADIALYAAKRSGGDRFSFYSPSIGLEVERRHRLFQEVRNGLERGEFTAAYQPVVHLRSGRIRGFEALVRWQHPTRGLLTAGEFAEALDDVALGRLISSAAAETAIRQFAQWRRAGLPIDVLGLNVSVGQIRDPGFTETILDMLAAETVPESELVLEITEGVLLGRGSENIMRRVKALHEKGIRIALDDFGTGYASLSHLREMPVDTIKIDKSFVSSMLTRPQDRTIVRSVVEMAHGLDKQVVAEGVETREAHSLLNLMSCEYGQGYYYSAAMLGDEVPGFLQSWNGSIAAAV